jgi:ATP phosphoribosyltransferase
MARYVQQGILDVGITGVDWTRENRAQVKEVADLQAPWPNYGSVRWVVAVKEG